ncbi:MAG: peptidoglycan-binding protein [Alphaproteobacteria bacterium]|nr:peptidoglycan-binding protein [Alphaproteobacteria bacterium]
MTVRLSALLALACLAACASPRVERDEARVAASAAPQPVLPIPVEAPPAATPAPPPRIGAPLALAPRNGDPIVVRATLAEPLAPAAPRMIDPPVPPASEDEIRLVQETLADQHLYRGPLDGLFTVELRDAVAQYQRRKGLRETALLDPETLRRLDADASGDATYGASEAAAKPAGAGR